MVTVTVLSDISQVTILDSITLYGDTRGAIPARPEHIRQVVDSVRYPLPEVEVIVLPFIIERIDDMHGQVDGVAAYGERKIYLSAFHRLDHTTEAYRLLGWAKTLLHELGHMVHYEYLPFPSLGPPAGLWHTFAEVAHAVPNVSYASSLAEHFAEWWRLLFSPASVSIPHRHGLPYKTGIKEWMLSLAGAQTLAIGHRAHYYRGEVTQRDVVPVIIAGRTMVPIRHIAELLGHIVEWSEPETVIIWPPQKEPG